MKKIGLKISFVIIFLLLSGGLMISENIYADSISEKSTTESVGVAGSTANVTIEQTPQEVSKFVNRKIKIKFVRIYSKTALKIIWKRVKEADGYIIYKQAENGTYKKIKTVKKQKQNYYIDKKAKYGNNYTYIVKAYKKYKGKRYYCKYDDKGVSKELKVKKKYKNGYKYYYDMENNRIDNVESFLKKPKYCIKVNLTSSVVTIYAKDGKKGYTIPVKAYLCSGNIYDTTGTFSLGEKYRYRTLYYNCYSQWASRIHDDILFHTVPYTRSQNPTSLDVKEYNLLGTPASHGCIRLQCVSVKWINDSCPIGTKVIMYKSDNPGALGKPKLEKLPSWHTWDPTDPTMEKKCKKAGCAHKTV